MNEWMRIDAERVLYVDRGRDTILCDRNCDGPTTILVKNATVVPECPGCGCELDDDGYELCDGCDREQFEENK